MNKPRVIGYADLPSFSIDLEWDEIPGANAYVILMKESGTTNSPVQKTPANYQGTTFAVTNLDEDT